MPTLPFLSETSQANSSTLRRIFVTLSLDFEDVLRNIPLDEFSEGHAVGDRGVGDGDVTGELAVKAV